MIVDKMVPQSRVIHEHLVTERVRAEKRPAATAHIFIDVLP
jgi:hypothetical protein